VRPGLVLTLSSALFKSYLRSSRRASVSFFSRPRVMLIIDAILFAIPALTLPYVVGALSSDNIVVLASLVPQAMISLPVLMTLAIIVSGLMFELGQGSVISSSEAVNWLPVSPREYVAASALSISSLYSFYLAVAAGVTLPLTAKLGFFYLWPVAMLLSVLSLLLGAFIVEFLKAIMNRVSSTVYKKKGRLAMAMRLIALIFLFSIVQMAFQPYFLYWALGEIVGGIEVAWVIPFVWPSVALVSLASYDLFKTTLFVLFSLLFTVAAYETASQLRRRYWSPIPVSISIDGSGEYLPRGSIGTGYGFSPLASALAMKEFRALLRRKDLSRFIAIPVVVAISLLVPTLASPSDMSGRAPGFFLAALIPFMVPFMFSSISIGQEGNSIMNLLSLPIKPSDLIKGKLAPAWLISCLATLGVIAAMEITAPLGLSDVLATVGISAITIIINCFIGLGIGSRWPDYTIGSRSRYVTVKGFIIGFILSGFATLAVFAPLGLHIVTSGGIRGLVPFSSLELLPMLTISIILGSALIILSYSFCEKGVESLLSNM
jgi:hypothetical protein